MHSSRASVFTQFLTQQESAEAVFPLPLSVVCFLTITILKMQTLLMIIDIIIPNYDKKTQLYIFYVYVYLNLLSVHSFQSVL